MLEDGPGSWRMDVGFPASSEMRGGCRVDGVKLKKKEETASQPLVLHRRPQITSASRLHDPPGWQPFTLSDTYVPFYAPTGGLTACCISQVCLHLCYLYICVLAASPPRLPPALLLKHCSTGAECALSAADINSLGEC